ncbi:O6-methylguanine-DNA--protein-cysteine methyltransferase [Thermonema lapsum]|uniref:O6-methylguanine-DNA--protein-cysteine methyltransferase n=1 Tax=Thermonema lapsum TaxID=28195 RepID=A0A846MQJ0_9BACT|nr:DUF1987 domain-containing protein [Thermonema lapsum]NIK73725.1 O6-methylguanine-DNA--protein-cysteine methyltransferase [Thermonema lapsum]
MNIISLEGKEDTPKVILDKDNGVFEISGRSLPEDAREFYRPIIEWLQQYASNPNPETVFNFKLEYFNTASSKLLLDVLQTLENIPNAKVVWYHLEEDEDMEEAGKEFEDMVNVEFEFRVLAD